jgi:hypothetical protein
LRTIKIVAIGLFTLALVACSNTVNIDSDYFAGTDFSTLKTYRWYDDVHESRTARYRTYNSSDKLMRQVVEAELKKKGLRPAAGDTGEFLVNYQIGAETVMNQTIHNNDPGVHGGVSTGTYGTSVALGVSVGSSGPTYYKEGTVVLDVIDTATNKVIWRSIADGRLPKDMGLNKRNEIIRELVPRMLEEFPPSP